MSDKYFNSSLKISWISVGVNLLVFLLKFILGILSNSISIFSDAVHSLSDLFTSAVVIFSLSLSRKPPDKEHPFGHGRIEDIGGLLLSFILVIVGAGFLKSSVLRLFSPQTVKLSFLFINIILFTAVIKLILGIFTQMVSQRVSSPLLKSDAYHHYSDFVTSVAVFGGLFFVKRGYVYVDSFLGIFVSMIVVLWGVKIGREFIDNLLGKKEPISFYEQIKEIALSFPFVEGVHDIEAHAYGKNRIISLHVETIPFLSLEEAHRIADNIEKKIYQRNLGRSIVHIDLKRKGAAADKKKIERSMKRLVVFVRKIKDFHGVKIISTDKGPVFSFHLLLEKGVSLEEAHLLSHRISDFLKEKFNFFDVNIHIEPYNNQ